MSRVVVRRVLLVAAVATSPLACFPALFAFNLVNPMQQAFLMEVDVENASGETIRVTPVGSVGAEGLRTKLPLFVRRIPAIPALRITQFPMGIGERWRLTYDWDDVVFAEILVEFPGGDFRIVTVDPAPTENLYHPAPEDRISIGPRDVLPVASASTQRLGQGSPFHFWLVGVLASSVIPIALTTLRSKLDVRIARSPTGGSADEPAGRRGPGVRS